MSSSSLLSQLPLHFFYPLPSRSNQSVFLEKTIEIGDMVNLDGEDFDFEFSCIVSVAEVLPEGALEKIKYWDKEKIEEATGNEGATMERW
jgi:hypothetical protein